uniref:60S ribosomal export protein NMD3 n=1 Tax=Phocoena sinus TaxID=42100 RepID=A0A8C9BAF8_PHOSS
MEYMTEPVKHTPGHILCCDRGAPISPNPASICVACLRSKVDIRQGIPKQVSLSLCKQCQRYFQPPGTWAQCALESRERLALCLKKFKAPLSNVRLVDASFVWTEPRSKRLNVKLTIQKEVMNGAILQQVSGFKSSQVVIPGRLPKSSSRKQVLDSFYIDYFRRRAYEESFFIRTCRALSPI